MFIPIYFLEYDFLWSSYLFRISRISLCAGFLFIFESRAARLYYCFVCPFFVFGSFVLFFIYRLSYLLSIGSFLTFLGFNTVLYYPLPSFFSIRVWFILCVSFSLSRSSFITFSGFNTGFVLTSSLSFFRGARSSFLTFSV